MATRPDRSEPARRARRARRGQAARWSRLGVGVVALLALTSGAVLAQEEADFSGTTLDIIALSGEDGATELEAWREERGITLASVPNVGWDDTFAKLTTDVFDIALVANPYVKLWGEAGAIRPLELERLSNWEYLFPALREGSFLRDEAGNVYAVPIAWGDGPYVYAPDRVASPPDSITELMDPAWQGRLTTFDDPILLFHMLAVAKGYPSPNLTHEQLADVKADAQTIVGNIRQFNATYDDALDLLVRGEVDLAIGGWEGMIKWAQDKGVTLDYGFFEEAHGGGWADSLAIPTNATDVDAAYAYIDAMISPEVNAQLATNLVSGTVNSQSLPLVAPEALIYDYTIVEDPENPIQFEVWTPPLEAEEGIATKADWDAAWNEIRAG